MTRQSIVAIGSTSDGGKLHPPGMEFTGESYCRKDCGVLQAETLQCPGTTLTVTASTSCHSDEPTSSFGLNNDTSSAVVVSSNNETNPDNSCVYSADTVAAAADSYSCPVVMGNRDNSTDTAEQRDQDVLTTTEDHLKSIGGSGAFIAMTGTDPAAAESQSNSVADPAAHDLLKTSTLSMPSSELLEAMVSSATAEVPDVSTDTQSAQLQDVESEDSNNNLRLNEVNCLTGQQSLQELDSTDDLVRLSCVVNCSLATPASDALYACYQSQIDYNSCHNGQMTQIEQECGALTAEETAVWVEDSLRTVFISVPAYSSVLESIHQLQQPHQSTGDQRQIGSDAVAEAEWQKTVSELQETFSVASLGVAADDCGLICDFEIPEIPEIPLFQNRVSSGVELQAINPQLVQHEASRCDIPGEASYSYEQSVAGAGITDRAICNTLNAASAASVDASVTCREAVDSASTAVSTGLSTEEANDVDVDVCDFSQSDQSVAAAFRQEAEKAFRPLDLTCSRTHSHTDTNRCVTTDVACPDGLSKPGMAYGSCVPMNTCNYRASHTAMCDCYPGWSMVQTASSYSVGWSPHHRPCCGHHGMYPGPHLPMFPGPHWPCYDAQEFQTRRRGTSRRRRRPLNSCSRVDGIRSTKVSHDAEPKDKVIPFRSENTTIPATGVLEPEVCSSSEKNSARPSSVSSVDTDVCESVSASTVVCSDSNPNPVPYATSNASVTDGAETVETVQRGRGGRRRGGVSRNIATKQPRRRSNAQRDDKSQPVVRGRKRGRPRKYPSLASVDSRPTQVQQPQPHDDNPDCLASVDAEAATASRRRSSSVRKTRETPDVETPETSMLQASTSSAGALPDVHGTADSTRPLSDTGVDVPTTDCRATTTVDNLPPVASLLESSSTTTDDLDVENADDDLHDPVAVSGVIIKKPRSRKQGCRVPANSTVAENTTGETEVVGAAPVMSSSSNPSGEPPASWQPLVTESAISSLLDTVSVAASDSETSAPSLTSCDVRLQTSASAPFVLLERADLNRCAIRLLFTIFWLFSYRSYAFLPSILIV